MSVVASVNPFALLDAEDASRPSSPAPAPKDTPQQAPAAQKPRNGPAARGGKYYQRGGAKAAPRDSGGNLNQNGIEEPVGKKFDGRGRGRGGARGARGGRGRPFDKHSQTGKTDSDKKIHQSWGGDDGKTEFKAEEAATLDAAAEGANEWAADTSAGAADAWGADNSAAADAWTAPSDAPAGDAGATGTPGDKPQPRRKDAEEEDNTLTLDEYLAQQKEKETSLLPKLESTRKVSDDNWKDVVPLQKGSEDSYFVGKTKAVPKARTKKEEKVFLDIEPRFERPSRGGTRGRGGDRGDRRGSGRGGRGGGFRGRGAAPSSSVDVDDQAAFPSLS